MGRPFAPFYGEGLGSAIEDVEKILEKIKTNKYDKAELAKFADALAIVAVKIKTELE